MRAHVFQARWVSSSGIIFLTIIEGKEKLPELGKKVLWEGAQDIIFEKI